MRSSVDSSSYSGYGGGGGGYSGGGGYGGGSSNYGGGGGGNYGGMDLLGFGGEEHLQRRPWSSRKALRISDVFFCQVAATMAVAAMAVVAATQGLCLKS